jgi:hypothetical protein
MTNDDAHRRCPRCGKVNRSCPVCVDRGQLAYDDRGQIVPTVFALMKVQQDEGWIGLLSSEQLRRAQAQTLIDAYLNGAKIGD